VRLVELSVEQQAELSDTIVVGRVSKTEGRLSVTKAETSVTVEVQRALKGDASGTLTFTVPGGQVGGHRTFVGGAPNFLVGERVLLFLRADGTRLLQLWNSKFALAGPEAIQPEVNRRLPIRQLEGRLTATLRRPALIGEEPAGRIVEQFTVLPGCIWPDSGQPVPWRVNTATAPGVGGVGGPAWVQVVYDALHVWQAVPGAHVSAYVAGTTGGTEIGDIAAFDDLNIIGWFDTNAFFGPGVLGATLCGTSPFSGLLDIDVIVDSNPVLGFVGSPPTAVPLNWDSNDANGIDPDSFSLSETVEHELGHSFGLGHTSTGCSTGSPPLMCPSAQLGTRTFLRTDDINGITSNYPLTGSPPAAPSALTAIQAGSNASLAWSPALGSVIAYDIERSTAGCGGAFKSVATVPSTTSFTDTNFGAGLPPGNICYRLKALGAGGDSAYSNTTALAAGPPASPRWISATPLSSTQVQLNWVDQSENENGFIVYRYGAGQSGEAGNLGANQTMFTDSGLAGGVHYIYSILSHNGEGFSLAPNTITAITPGGTPAPPVLESVVGISTTQMQMTWRDNSSNEAGFQVFRFDPLNPGAGYTGLGELPPGTTTFTDGGLVAGQSYYYWVVAQNGLFSGFSPAIFSGSTFAASPDPEAPQMTGGITVSASEVGISWVDNTSDESGFYVRRWSGVAWELVATLAAGSTSYVDQGLSSSTAYQYQVSAFNDVYDKVSPAPLSVTTSGAWPAPPMLRSAVGLSQTTIRVNWQDTSSNETGFRLVRTDSVTGATMEINLAPGSTTYLDGGLVPGRYYYYWIWALGSRGNGYAATIIPANTFAP
jgi:hypothetical protein